MKEILTNLDYQEVIVTIWTVIILPILTYAGTQINDWLKAKKLDKYTNILKENGEIAIKDVQATYVDDLKGTEQWTAESKTKALELAKNKVIYALTDSAYKALKIANTDFEEYLEGLIECTIYDLKH